MAVPERPEGVPETFKEHAELMFDLQVLALQAEITRVSSFMMARENIDRPYREIGLPEAHHAMSHHGNNPEKMAMFSKLNTYHAETFAYCLNKLQGIPDGDGTLLDHTVVLYGSGISDGNQHNFSPLPIVPVVLMLATPRGRSDGPAFVAAWMPTHRWRIATSVQAHDC